MTNIGAVIGWKFNHQSGMTTRDGVITKFPNGIPSQADQDKWTKEYEDHLASTQYQRDRLEEYPSIEECVHAILDNDLDALQIKRQAVKQKYPKENN